MNSTQKGIITMINSALKERAQSLGDDFSLESAYPLILDQQIPVLAYEGALLCGVDKAHPVMKKLFLIYVREVQHNEKQQKYIREILDKLESAGIDYMALKGCQLKTLYTKPEWRRMGDADILVREKDRKRAYAVMKELGYQEGLSADNDVTFIKDHIHIEIHHALMSEDDGGLYHYFGDGWPRAIAEGKHSYGFSPEDHYIYLFSHFAKHYINGGVGCRHFMDLWVYRNAHPDLDETYIANELDEMGLLPFHQNTLRALSAWFDGGEWDATTEMITDYLFDNGSWGSVESLALGRIAKIKPKMATPMSVKTRNEIDRFFPSLREMKGRYGVLRRHAWLLPVFWVVRWFDVLWHRPENLKKHIEENKALNQGALTEFEKKLQAVGLSLDR